VKFRQSIGVNDGNSYVHRVNVRNLSRQVNGGKHERESENANDWRRKPVINNPISVR
jgi:hypothetical protein